MKIPTFWPSAGIQSGVDSMLCC